MGYPPPMGVDPVSHLGRFCGGSRVFPRTPPPPQAEPPLPFRITSVAERAPSSNSELGFSFRLPSSIFSLFGPRLITLRAPDFVESIPRSSFSNPSHTTLPWGPEFSSPKRSCFKTGAFTLRCTLCEVFMTAALPSAVLFLSGFSSL